MALTLTVKKLHTYFHILVQSFWSLPQPYILMSMDSSSECQHESTLCPVLRLFCVRTGCPYVVQTGVDQNAFPPTPRLVEWSISIETRSLFLYQVQVKRAFVTGTIVFCPRNNFSVSTTINTQILSATIETQCTLAEQTLPHVLDIYSANDSRRKLIQRP